MKAEPVKTNWRKEYDNQTSLWKNSCIARWDRAERLIEQGHVIVILPALTKRTLPRAENMGIHNPISTVKTLRIHTSPGGKYHDCNYGIVTGQGRCMVLDLDCSEERPGVESLVDMESKFSFYVPRQCMVRTPSGGQHIYLAYDENVSPRTRPFGQAIGIDILTSNGVKASRHAVGPGSVTESGEYEEDPKYPICSVSMLQEYELPSEFKKLLPQSSNVVDMKGRPTHVGNGRGNEEVGEDDVFGKMTLADVQEVLDNIDVKNLSFDEWLDVGMALHHERGEDGYDLWNEWSAGDPDRYDVKACQSHWDTFKDVPRPVTMGTPIMLAKREGYRVKPKQRALSVMEEIQRGTPNAYLGGQCKFVRVTEDGEVQEMSREDAKSWYEGQEVIVNGKPVNPINLFMRWSGRIRHDRYELLPPPVVCPPTTVNVWRGYAIKPEEGYTTRYMELFNMMMGDDVREWVHDWFADLVQNTGKKPDTAIVLQGPEGTGKNTLINVFRSMFLDNNTTHFVSTDQFTSKFNKHIARSVLAIVNEAVWSGNHKHASMLKGYISEDKFEVQDKNVKGFQARNCTRIVIMSNEDWAVPADRDARRFCVCHINRTIDSSDPWWKQTKKILTDKKTIAAVMHWYSKRTITNNLHKVPQTTELMHQKLHTKSKMRQEDKPFVAVTLRLLKNSQAVARDDKHLISSDMIKRAYFYAMEKKCDDQFIWAYNRWLARNLEVHIETGIKTKYKGVQRQASYWPPLATVASALAKFEMVDKNNIECHDEWSEDDIEW